MKRIQARRRSEEQSIDLDYLQTLHERHEEWLNSQTISLKTPVLIIDANQTKDNVYNETNTQILTVASC